MNRLHQAVVQNDLRAIESMANEPQLFNEPDRQGFLAVELARLLAKNEVLAKILPTCPRKIQVRPRGKKEIIMQSEHEFYNYFNVIYRPYLRFENYNFLQKTLKRCPWLLSKSSFGQENRCQAKYFEKQLKEGFVADVFIAWIDDHIGHGLFAGQDLPSGLFVAEFTGLVRRLYRLNPNQNAYCFHYPTRFASLQYTVIDALLEILKLWP